MKVKCLEETQKNYKWPAHPDELFYSLCDIQKIIKEPKMLKRGFYYVPELSIYSQ